jgi:hypothetical protein
MSSTTFAGSTLLHPLKSVARKTQIACWAERVRSAQVHQTSIFLGDREGIVDLDTEVPNCAFDLGMAKQKLHCTQVASATVDQRRFGSAHGMCGEFAWVEANAGNPA